MKEFFDKFIQANSPDGGFLQSEEWRKFQETYGRKTFHLEGENFWANIIEHKLRLVGKYFYIPRGPVTCHLERSETVETCLPAGRDLNAELDSSTTVGMTNLIDLSKKEKAGWIRIEPVNDESLALMRKNTGHKITKAPHDVQPKEIFAIDISKPEEQLLAEMKAKTRYNIKLSQKRGVSAKVISNFQFPISNQIQKPNDPKAKVYFDKFIELVKVTAKRNEISAHPEEYYRKMWETLPEDMLRLYVAEYDGRVIAANLVLYYGKFATYLHGSSDNAFREVMAPYLLQWQAILDAKKAGCTKYDFGGVSISQKNKLQGVTKFKLGFSPKTGPINFPGSYDIIIDKKRYYLYRTLQAVKNII